MINESLLGKKIWFRKDGWIDKRLLLNCSEILFYFECYDSAQPGIQEVTLKPNGNWFKDEWFIVASYQNKQTKFEQK